ncbi:hypothetical protein VDP44_21685, partial [Xanthomonas campestris pv. campestris]|nr:hypothetical protein [Xanthomonas campestris pv. campestris]
SQQRSTLQPRALSVITGTDDGGRSVPNYEAARHYFEAAIANGVFEPRSAPSYYDQEEMRAVLNWAQEQQEQA